MFQQEGKKIDYNVYFIFLYQAFVLLLQAIFFCSVMMCSVLFQFFSVVLLYSLCLICTVQHSSHGMYVGFDEPTGLELVHFWAKFLKR